MDNSTNSLERSAPNPLDRARAALAGPLFEDAQGEMAMEHLALLQEVEGAIRARGNWDGALWQVWSDALSSQVGAWAAWRQSQAILWSETELQQGAALLRPEEGLSGLMHAAQRLRGAAQEQLALALISDWPQPLDSRPGIPGENAWQMEQALLGLRSCALAPRAQELSQGSRAPWAQGSTAKARWERLRASGAPLPQWLAPLWALSELGLPRGVSGCVWLDGPGLLVGALGEERLSSLRQALATAAELAGPGMERRGHELMIFYVSLISGACEAGPGFGARESRELLAWSLGHGDLGERFGPWSGACALPLWSALCVREFDIFAPAVARACQSRRLELLFARWEPSHGAPRWGGCVGARLDAAPLVALSLWARPGGEALAVRFMTLSREAQGRAGGLDPRIDPFALSAPTPSLRDEKAWGASERGGDEPLEMMERALLGFLERAQKRLLWREGELAGLREQLRASRLSSAGADPGEAAQEARWERLALAAATRAQGEGARSASGRGRARL